jgi:hypothetical protein
MRYSSNKKSTSSADRKEELRRREELRQARAAAPTLREACPAAAFVRVELAFQTDSGPDHAPQAFSVYPPAKAHFVYACPFGDCDGVYDLNGIAFGTLQAGRHKTRGRLTCTGTRSREGKPASPCELAATYSIVVKHENEAPAPSDGPEGES